MTETPALTSEATISLREVTKKTVRTICRLSNTLSPEHQRMVAPNAVSIAEAHFEPHAWFRAIYADETPVGFAMLYIGPDDDRPGETVYFLWRYMIAGPYHKLGYGKRAMQLLVDHVRSLGAKEFITSCGEGEGSPEGFYLNYGFMRNGKMYDDEVGLHLLL